MASLTCNKSISRSENSIIHGNFQKIHRETQRLWRLLRLDKTLPRNDERSHSIQSLQKILRTAAKASEIDLPGLYEHLDELQPGIATLFRCEFSPEEGDTVQKIRRFLAETQLLISSPLRKSQKGNKGPTFLVNPCLGSFRHPEACVIKWSTPYEHASTRIYQEISKQSFLSCGFSVPSSVYINFHQRRFEAANRSTEFFSPEDSQSLEETLSHIAQKCHPGVKLNGRYLMMAERVRGGNLIDFGCNRYSAFKDPQKKIFFHHLGQLAFLDLILGYMDRLIQVNRAGEKYILDNDLEVNLGNVMVSWAPGEEHFTLSAIDNEIHSELVEDSECREKYLSFLKTLFSSGQGFDPLVENFVTCFRCALSSQVDDLPGNVQKHRHSLSLLSSDINDKMFQNCFKKGLQEMANWLQREFIPKHWESKNSQPLKTSLSEIHPALLRAVEERLHCFKNTRTK